MLTSTFITPDFSQSCAVHIQTTHSTITNNNDGRNDGWESGAAFIGLLKALLCRGHQSERWSSPCSRNPAKFKSSKL